MQPLVVDANRAAQAVAQIERLVRNEMLRGRSTEDLYRGLDWIYGYGRVPPASGSMAGGAAG